MCTNESGLGPSLVCVRNVMFIPDPDPDFLPIPDPGFRIPDPGVKKAPDLGSGSATLTANLINAHEYRY
jgi:hypothetical protein